MKRIALALLAFALAGCGPNLAEAIKAAAGDPASVCLSVGTLYGTVNFARSAIASGRVTCQAGALTVESQPAPPSP